MTILYLVPIVLTLIFLLGIKDSWHYASIHWAKNTEALERFSQTLSRLTLTFAEAEKTLLEFTAVCRKATRASRELF